MRRLVFSSITSVLLAFGPTAAMADCADLSLVLAVDSSSSVDKDEFRMQATGYAAAFRDPTVLRALQEAGTVDVAAVFWADAATPPVVIPWHRLTGAEDAAALADSFLSVQRGVFGDTDIGRGLMDALDLLDAPGRCSARALVNLSGDGRASNASRRAHSVSVAAARERAEAMGVTINALAILNAEPSLAEYYQNQLITGPGSFVVEAEDFSAFGAAIIRKLDREIRPQLSAAVEDGQPRLWK